MTLNGGKRKGAGRPKGAKSKKSQMIEEKLAKLKCDPLEAMARIMKEADKAGDHALALSAAKELAQYVAPKRKAIEHSGAEGEAIQHDLNFTVKGV